MGVTTHIVQVEPKASFANVALALESNGQEVSTSNSNDNVTMENALINLGDTDNQQELRDLEKLHQIYANTKLEIEQILSSNDKGSEVYISALYEKTRINQISEEDLRRELDNILLYSLLYTDLSDEEWEKAFGKLQATLPREANAVEYYYPLAAYLHKYNCSLEHRPDFEGMDTVTCEDLQKRSQELQKQRAYFDYVACMISSSEDQELIDKFDRLCKACGENTDGLLDELSVMYTYSQVPRCLSEEEYGYFKIMLSTVGEYDNIFEVYRKVAIFVHLLDCDFDHYVDECDVHVCKGLEKTLE